MALGDNIPDAAEDLVGRVKEAAGKASHNDNLTASGQGDQAKARIMKGDDSLKGVVE